MKKIGLFGLIIMMLMVACTPAEDNTLPTRVVLPTDANTVAETTPSIDLIAETTPTIDLIAETTPTIDLIAEVTAPVDTITNPTAIPSNNNTAPIVIPAQQTQLPTITPAGDLNVVMPTFDLTNLPTSIPTATPYPVVENFGTVAPSTQLVRLRGTIEVFIEPVRDDDIFLLRGADGVAIELLWDIQTIDYIPARAQVIEAFGIIETSNTGHSTLLMKTQSIVPITAADEGDV